MTTKIITLAMLVSACWMSATAGPSSAPSVTTERIYLSGRGAEDHVEWDFRLEHGRGSGVWTKIRAPSCWELQGFGEYEYIEVTQNRGFYRTTFDLPESSGNRRILLFFDGVLTQAAVTVNGQSAGPAHQGGYFRFSYDITDLVQQTGNLLEVTVQKMADDPALDKTHRGDFWNFSGIFRPVYLKIVPREYIDWFAVNGDMDGSLALDVYPKHIEQVDAIRATIRDRDGKPVGAPLLAELHAGQEKVSLHGHFPGVKLWSDESPYLYHIDVELLDDGRTVHRESDRFGFRRFENIPGKGFFLNGRRIVLKGAARQSFWPDTGRTLSTKIHRKDVELMKNFLNMNFVRSAHCDPDEEFLDLCDELGLLASTELNGWVSPMPTEPGKALVKALVAKDANHPSLVQWNNGNHRGSNPELIGEYEKWDPQKRMVIINEPKAYPRVPGIEIFGDAAIDTRYYPTFAQITERLAPGRVNTVMPNEMLHGLYDGGGGAALFDYYRAFRNSAVGGGIVLWALIDEAVVRTDKDSRLDKQGNRAPDGIVGLYRELEGSAYAVREIFSPIQFRQEYLPGDFKGDLLLTNEYTFTSLDHIRFDWELVNYPTPFESDRATTILARGSDRGPTVQPGETGVLKLSLPPVAAQADALRVRAFGINGAEVISRTWPLKSREEFITAAFREEGKPRASDDGFQFSSGEAVFSFHPKNGQLASVETGGRAMALKNGPQFVWSVTTGDEVDENGDSIDAEALKALGERAIAPAKDKFDSPWVPQTLDTSAWHAEAFIEDGRHVIESKAPNGEGYFRWTVSGNGVLRLDYSVRLPRGIYGFAGIAFDLEEACVLSKRWLGGGPTRVWKNRLHGPEFGLWENGYNNGVPGEIWELPAFKGIFKDVAWANIQTTTGQLVIGLADPAAYLGVLRPANGTSPRWAIWSYPPEGGLFVFNAISPVGAKWRAPHEAGPSSASNKLDDPIAGTIFFRVAGPPTKR